MKAIFTVRGEPKGKERPRFTRGGIAYTPNQTRNYERYIKSEYIRQTKGKKFDDDAMINMYVEAFFPIPKNYTKAKRKLIADGMLSPKRKPDADNILKAVADALNGVAYRDDAQISMAMIKKRFTEGEPRVEVVIWDEAETEAAE